MTSATLLKNSHYTKDCGESLDLKSWRLHPKLICFREFFVNILADENMPCLALFEPYARIITVPGRHIQATDLKDIDLLLVRSVTQVTSELLQHANKLKGVGTATIGTDHIDRAWLQQQGIACYNAAGCNALAVGQYAATALLGLAKREQIELKTKPVGILGAGHTGRALGQILACLDVPFVYCDPWVNPTTLNAPLVDVETLMAHSKVLACHVPLIADGQHPTQHWLNAKRLQNLADDVWLLNAGRGGVWDNQALLQWKRDRPNAHLVLDVWENEPDVLAELVPMATLATPHIAGYSLEGKMRGTYQLFEAFATDFGWHAPSPLSDLMPATKHSIRLSGNLTQAQLLELCLHCVPLHEIDHSFRNRFQNDGGFDKLRKSHIHREWSSVEVCTQDTIGVKLLTSLGFSIQN
jgi:erythronate-4-phosphate dehydrogenase